RRSTGVTHLMSAVQAFRLARGSYPDSDADTERPLLALSQQNGHLYVFEYIDLSTTKINKAKERAGWWLTCSMILKASVPRQRRSRWCDLRKTQALSRLITQRQFCAGARK